MKFWVKMETFVEADLDEESGEVSSAKTMDTKLYASLDFVQWGLLEGAEIDSAMTNKVNDILGKL